MLWTSRGPPVGLLTCAVVGGAPGEAIAHLHLDIATERWTQRWRQWLLGAGLLQKFGQCPVRESDEKQHPCRFLLRHWPGSALSKASPGHHRFTAWPWATLSTSLGPPSVRP